MTLIATNLTARTYIVTYGISKASAHRVIERASDLAAECGHRIVCDLYPESFGHDNYAVIKGRLPLDC